jgi:hypothetical protein
VCSKEGQGRKVKEDQGTVAFEETNFVEEDSEPKDTNEGSVKKKKRSSMVAERG